MTLEQFTDNLRLFIGLASLTFLWFCWRSYRVDAFRENLFALRQELFDYAATNAIAFDDPAYYLLRLRINGLIQFGHRISFARLGASLAFFMCSADAKQVLTKKTKIWQESVHKVDKKVQDHLMAIDREMSMLLVKHMVLGSPLLLGLFIITIPLFFIHTVGLRIWQGLADIVPGLDLLEAQAVMGQTHSRTPA